MVLWIQKQQTMAYLMEFIERMAGGIQIWKYPQGNMQAHEETKAAAEGYNSGEQHVLLVPVPAGDVGQYGVEVVNTGFDGLETLHSLLTQFFANRIKRYILGQVLSSESAATGLGSGVADLHAETLLQILKSDATNLEETLTCELLESLIRINVQKGLWHEPGFRPRFVIETEEADVQAKLQAWCNLLDRGLPIRKSDLYDMIGAATPGPGDDVLDGTKKSSGEESQSPTGSKPQAPKPGAPAERHTAAAGTR